MQSNGYLHVSHLESFVSDFVKGLLSDVERRKLLEESVSKKSAFVEDGVAAVVMIDISGYSKVTSKLAQHGKVSSELITRAVCDFMSRIIEIVVAWKGDVIRFIGDAIIVTWRQDTTKLQAIEMAILCCFTIQRDTPNFEFDATDLIRLAYISAGPKSGRESDSKAKFGLHMGITYGPIQSVVLGDANLRLDYVVAGECLKDIGNLLTEAPEAPTFGTLFGMASQYALFHSTSTAVEVLNSISFTSSPTILAALNLDPSQTNATSLQHHLMSKFINASIVATFDNQSFLSTSAGQFRQISVIFIKLLQDFDPTIAQDAMVKFLDALNNNGGVFQQYAGDIVNQCARLLGVASPTDTPIVCDTPTISTANGFNGSSLGFFHLKGMQNDIEVWKVDSEESGNDAVKTHDLFGYRTERKKLVTELDAWQDGQRSPVVLIQGPSGIGKSELHHFLASEATFRKQRLCITRISKESQLIPFTSLQTLFIFAITETLPKHKTIYEKHLKRSNTSRAISMDHSDREQTIKALRAALVDINEDPDYYPVFSPFFPKLGHEETPLTAKLVESARKGFTGVFAAKFIMGCLRKVKALLVFDDVQWIDSASQEILNQLVTFSEDKCVAGQIFLVFCCRPNSEIQPEQLEIILESPNLTHLPLSGLHKDDIEEFLLKTCSQTGYPILLQTIADMLHRNSCFKTSTHRLEFHPQKIEFVNQFLQTTLSQATMMQFDRLHPDFQRFLRYACISGQYFHLDAVIEHIPSTQDAKFWKEIMSTKDKYSFLQSDESGGYFFRHISIQIAIYESLPYAELMALHQTFAESLERKVVGEGSFLRESVLPRLYHHWWQTNHFEKKIKCAEELGLYYRRKGYHNEAISALTSLLEFVDDPTQIEKIAPEYSNKVRLAFWYSILANSASLSCNAEVTLDAALKTVNRCSGYGFPTPATCSFGSVLKRLVKHLMRLWKFRSKRVSGKVLSQEMLDLTNHSHLGFNALIVLSMMSGSNNLPPLYPAVTLLEMLNEAMVVKEELPLLWVNAAGITSFALSSILPQKSRLYLDSALFFARKNNLLYPSMLVFTTSMAMFSIDEDGQDAVDHISHIAEYVALYISTRNYEITLSKAILQFQLRIKYPDSLDQVESCVMKHHSQCMVENIMVAEGSLELLTRCAIYASDQTRTNFYLKKIKEIFKVNRKMAGDRIWKCMDLTVLIWKAVAKGDIEATLKHMHGLAIVASASKSFMNQTMTIEAGLLAIWPLYTKMQHQTKLSTMFKLHKKSLSEIFRLVAPFLKALGRGALAVKGLSKLLGAAELVFKGRRKRAWQQLNDLMYARYRIVMERSVPHVYATAYAGLWLLSGDEGMRKHSRDICEAKHLDAVKGWVDDAVPFS
ncbi:hypothetical protein HDU97_001196 [Phlyctochytrium planicorne]|nr:hypothetical protein HDU97_001196 [Phlyctochytrium planicorne]